MKAETKHVFFDLDHTLWDFEKNSALAFEKIFREHNIVIDHATFISHYVPINARYWKLYRDDKISQQELRYGRLKESFDLTGFKISDDLLNVLSADYIQSLPTYNHLYDGTIEILEYLKSRYQLHIITNGFHEVQASKLRNSNIEHYFATITNSENAGCKKPNPEIFEYALKAASAHKAHSVMIGDCIEADVQGALDCGLRAIFFNEHRAEVPESIIQVRHLLDLKKIL